MNLAQDYNFLQHCDLKILYWNQFILDSFQSCFLILQICNSGFNLF